MATTPNYSLSIYDSSDTDVRFLDFRVAIAGTQTTSNFYVIDGALKEHSDAINTLKNSPQAYIVKANFASGVYNASVSGFPGYKTNQLIVLSLNQTNTGAVSININNSSAKNVMLYNANGILRNFIAGEFVSNSPALCYYDGTQFVTIGIPRGSATYVDGERGDVLQISSDGAIESSGKQIGNPNGIATLDENGNVVQVANMANSAAAVYSGEPVTVEYAGENRISSITAYGNNSQTSGTTTEPVFLPGVDRAVIFERLPANLASPNEALEVKGVSVIPNADGSVTVKGTATNETWPRLVGVNIPSAIIAGDITISLSSPASVKMVFQSRSPSGKVENVYLSAGYTSVTTKIKSGYTGMHIFLSLLPDQTIDETFYIMIAQGTEAKAFSPYVAPSITQLPIPRELHRIGDATDKCVTRTNSEYNRRLVFVGDDTEGWSLRSGTAHTFAITAGTGTIKKGASNRYKNILIDDFDETNGIYLSGNTLMVAVSDLSCNSVTEFKNKLKSEPLIVYVQAAGYDGTNGLDVCLTEYQNGFVELDGTEDVIFDVYGDTQKRIRFDLDSKAIARYALKFSHGNPGDVPTVTGSLSASFNRDMLNRLQIIGIPDTWTALGVTDTATAKTWLAAQKAAGTPVQVVYQLATPEVYATDPVDFDNTAGPLTVVTGGQVEVKMTDFITDRTPAFLNKLDKTGDGSDVTVTFTEATTDADIASGAKMSILFGKILKRFSTITSKFTTVDNSITQIESDISDITDGTTVVAQANKVTNALVIMSNSGTALVNYDGSATANMTLSPSNVGAEPAFTKNTAFNKNFGSSAGTVCQGNDSRLSNARRSSNISMSLSGTNLSISYS